MERCGGLARDARCDLRGRAEIATIIAFVLGVIAAAQARADREETPLLLARIAWIGALVMLGLGILVVLGVIALFGVLGLAGIWSLGPMDF